MRQLLVIAVLLAAAPALPAQAPADGWRQDSRWPGWWLYYQAGSCKGAFSPDGKAWQEYGPAGWGAKFTLKAKGCGCCPGCACGADCPCRATGEPCCPGCGCVPVVNHGIDLKELAKTDGADKYLVNGRPASRAKALLALAGGQLADDGHKLRLTVIGPEAERKQVFADLAAAGPLAEWREKLLVQGYEPAHWAVALCGFKTDGKPTIYLQAPDGKVLHRQDDYQGGAEALAGAIRKADPDYKPEKDADRRKAPALPALPGWVPEWAPWAAAGAALLLLLRPKGK